MSVGRVFFAMKTKQFNIFHTPIWHTKILNDQENIQLEQYILHKRISETGVKKTNVGGWQSDNILGDKKFDDLINEIVKTIKNTDLEIHKIKICNAWCNINSKNNWNVIHNHGQYSLSAVYFVKKPLNSGDLSFRDPRAILTATWGGWADKIYKMYNENAIININARERDLIIFPSFLDHFVTPSNSDQERISIAFDIECF